jgi:hypothetical protein
MKIGIAVKLITDPVGSNIFKGGEQRLGSKIRQHDAKPRFEVHKRCLIFPPSGSNL